MNEHLTAERLQEVYDYLVDETEVRSTLHNLNKSRLLHCLLEVAEYLLGNTNENPLPDWFEE